MRSLRDDLSLSFRRLTKHVSLRKDDFKAVSEQTRIWLVEFDPDDSGLLRFKRHVFRLSEAPKFDALSYSWGTSPAREKVECDGEVIDIPTALSAYLRSLYHFRPIRYLWIDVMCIDDGHYGNRDYDDISILCVIYRKAARTICFAGFKDCRSMKILTDITRTIGDYREVIVGLLSSTDIYHSTHKIGHEHLKAFETIASPIGENTRRDLNDFFNQTYFRGLRSIPDLVCSKNPLIFDGSDAIPTSQLAEGLLAWLLFSPQTLLQSPGTMTLLLADVMHRKYHGFHGTHITLPDLLLLTRACEVTIGRTEDFSQIPYFIGKYIISEGPLSTYSIKDSSGSALAAMHLNILSSQPLSLSLVDEDVLDLPSWIPRWAERSKRFLLNHGASNFAASTHMPPTTASKSSQTAERIETTVFECDGVVIDAIQRIAGYMPPRRFCDHYAVSGDNSFFYTEWFEFANDVLHSTRTDEQVTLEYVDTIQARGCGHIWEHPIQNPQERLQNVRHFLDFLENPDAEETNSVRIFHAACYPSHDRRLGVTQAKRLCLVPNATKVGDLVCVPHGSRVPYIFRKRRDGVSYQNIGEAYVHGAMNSEFSGIKELEEQKFHVS